MYDGFRKDDFAYFKIDLLIFEYFYLINPSFNTHILKNVNGQIDYL